MSKVGGERILRATERSEFLIGNEIERDATVEL